MGTIHEWGRNTRTTVDEVKREYKYYLELRADDDEEKVRVFWDDRVSYPQFIVAPDKHDSRSNSVVGSNIRRMLGSEVPIAVMVAGKKRRERLDMLHWLISEDYLPMFPRFMYCEANPAVPLTRLQLMHEARPILDREPDWIFVLHNFSLREQTARDYAATTQNSWEILS